MFDAIAAGASDSAALLAALGSTTSVPTVMAALVGPWRRPLERGDADAVVRRDALGRRSPLRARPAAITTARRCCSRRWRRCSPTAARRGKSCPSTASAASNCSTARRGTAGGGARRRRSRRSTGRSPPPPKPQPTRRARCCALSAAVRVRAVRAGAGARRGARGGDVQRRSRLDGLARSPTPTCRRPSRSTSSTSPSCSPPRRIGWRRCVAQRAAAHFRRAWRLVFIDVSLDEPPRARAAGGVAAPAATVMDVNIGAALWFAARPRHAAHPPRRALPPSADLRYAADGDGDGDGDVTLEDDIVDDGAGVPQREYPSDDEACAEGALDGGVPQRGSRAAAWDGRRRADGWAWPLPHRVPQGRRRGAAPRAGGRLRADVAAQPRPRRPRARTGARAAPLPRRGRHRASRACCCCSLRARARARRRRQGGARRARARPRAERRAAEGAIQFGTRIANRRPRARTAARRRTLRFALASKPESHRG